MSYNKELKTTDNAQVWKRAYKQYVASITLHCLI